MIDSNQFRVCRRVPSSLKSILLLAVLIVPILLFGCAWSLQDAPNTGVLRISLGSGDQMSGLDFNNYYEATFFVVEADYFRQGGRVVSVGPSGDAIFGEGEGFRTEFIRANLVSDQQGFSVDEIVRPIEGDFLAVAGGRAMYLDDGGLQDLGTIEFSDLVVGKEYVIWIDAETWEDGYHLGFSTVRIRSGAPTTVTVNLSEDRFPQFLDLLYDRYVKPTLPPLNLSTASMVLYAGSGSATVFADDDSGDPWNETPTYNRALVARFAIPNADINLFFMVFYEEGTELEGDYASLVVTLFEQDGVLEPSRSSYGMSLFDPDTGFYSFTPGTLGGVEVAFGEGPEFSINFFNDDPPTLGNAGFIGGGPSKGGTFGLTIAGPGSVYGEDPASVSVSNLVFTYGPVLETFDDFLFEGDFAFRPPQEFTIDEPIDWYTALDDLEYDEILPMLVVGDFVTVTLPPAPAGYAEFAVLWGDLVYTDDSHIGGAAVHAGILTLEGGSVTLEVLPGQSSYPGASRNGITSESWDFWYRSFSFEGIGW